MGYNKIIHLLKTTKIFHEWLNKLEVIYQFINKSMTAHINYHQTMKYQLPMTRKRGGLGLRSPKLF